MKQKALFLDRDGVINVDHGYISTPDRFHYMDDAFCFLRAARGQGYRLVIVTNQSGVARGYFSRQAYEDLTAYMLRTMAEADVTIDLVLACFKLEGYWRKPNPGMILEAAARLDLDLAASIMLGDQPRDLEAGHLAGIPRLFWITPEDTQAQTPLGAERAANLREVALSLGLRPS